MEWKDELEYVLKTLCVIIITYGIPTLLSALKKKTDNEYAHKAIDFAGTVIADCVKATNQTFVEALKKEGKFDAEAAKTAFILRERKNTPFSRGTATSRTADALKTGASSKSAMFTF